MNIKYVLNDRWETTNNIYSLYGLALKKINSDFILLESDIFFGPHLLDVFFENRGQTSFY